jgi:hypothetical protein
MAKNGGYSSGGGGAHERPSKEQVTGHHTPTPGAGVTKEQAHELSLKHPSQHSHKDQL